MTDDGRASPPRSLAALTEGASPWSADMSHGLSSALEGKKCARSCVGRGRQTVSTLWRGRFAHQPEAVSVHELRSRTRQSGGSAAGESLTTADVVSSSRVSEGDDGEHGRCERRAIAAGGPATGTPGQVRAMQKLPHPACARDASARDGDGERGVRRDGRRARDATAMGTCQRRCGKPKCAS